MRSPVAHYRLAVYRDRETRDESERLSLSARDDGQAVEQMRAEARKHEIAGESRVLVLSRPDGGGWDEVARMGTRRYS